MHIEIITPDKTVYSGEINSVKLPGKDGSFGILKNHAPMISTLRVGKIKVVDAANATHYFDVKGGVVEVNNNNIIVLAD
jgi:F-type H+-transporting ATPase subunit epsilon